MHARVVLGAGKGVLSSEVPLYVPLYAVINCELREV